MQQLSSATPNEAAWESAARMLEVVPLVMRQIRQVMRAAGGTALSVPQFRALGYIDRHPDCSVSAVAEHVGLSEAAASRLIETLVQEGYVERATLATNRRFVALRLAPEGQRIRTLAQQHALRALAERMAALDEDDFAAINQALETLRGLFIEDRKADEGIAQMTERDL